MPPKKNSAGSGESAPNRRSSKKSDASNQGLNASLEHPHSPNEGLNASLEHPHSPNKGLNASLEHPHSSNKGLNTSNPRSRSSNRKPASSSVSSPSPKKRTNPSRKTAVSANPNKMPQPSKERDGMAATETETAASGEPPVPGEQGSKKSLKTAVIFYLIFALGLLAIHAWNPVNAVISTSPGLEGTVDLTGRQIEFEAAWRRKLRELNPNGEALSQTSSSRLREENMGVIHPNGFFWGNDPGTVKWIHSEVKLVFPESENEAQLVKTGGAWKEICGSMGLVISKTTWGYTNNTLWVVLDSEGDIESGVRRLSLPMQKLTLMQPLHSDHRKTLNWRGLIPKNPPTLVAPVPKPTVKPVPTTGPTPKPVSSPGKALAVKQRPTSVPIPSPLLIPSPKPPRIKVRAKVAIIIDDVGATRDEATEAFFQVPARLTWSVMPLMPYGDHYRAAGKEHGFEIMLHLPLEPLDAKINPGPGVIKVAWPEEEIRQKLDEDLQSVPDAVGINNHMGSAGTSDDRLMDILMRVVKEKGLYFVDSMTYKTSVAGIYAQQYRIPFAKRVVFIDNQSTLESKKKQLRELINKALKYGSAVGIGHVRPNTAEAIIEMLPEFVKAGVAIVPVSELVR